MFALKPRMVIAFRFVLIVTILGNAVLPMGVTALQPETELQKAAPSATSNSDLRAKVARFFETLLQEATPTPSPIPTEIPLEEPSFTPSPQTTQVITPTPEVPLPVTPLAPDNPFTPTPSETVATPTARPSIDVSGLSIDFFASSNTAAIGDEVTFTVTMTNTTQAPISGLHFSNRLPEGFQYIKRTDKEITFDEQTREIRWGDDSVEPLMPGQSQVVEYAVIITALSVEEAQIIDTAVISADYLTQPVIVETDLLVSPPGSSLTSLSTHGGEAVGLHGKVKLNFSSKVLHEPRTIFIQDLRTTPAANPDREPWIAFELGLRIPEQTAVLDATAAVNQSPQSTASSLSETDLITPLVSVESEFEEPVELNVSLDGLVDLAELGADQTPFLVTLDEESGTWVRVPLTGLDRQENTIKAELSHFSTWGVGVGPSFPTNSSSVLLFDTAFPTLFTGRSKYSIPLWTPPGRNGLQPHLTLSYSSGSADGILGDIQAPWVGMGWNIDSVEIARKITSGGGSYGYKNEFILLFNGTGYELVRDNVVASRYHTTDESFLYIQLHNDVVGTPSDVNQTGEWWEVVEKDGTRWELGNTADSEQLAAMLGYPGAATGAWATLGYAGDAIDVVASRWRVNQVKDVYGNIMKYAYSEAHNVTGSSINTTYDCASYIQSITYTDLVANSNQPAYKVEFVRESRGGADVPASPNVWDNWEWERLDRVDVYYWNGSQFIPIRSYDMGYTVQPHTDGGTTWQTTMLTSFASSGRTTSDSTWTSAPTVTFAYTDYDNRAPSSGNSNEWAYPRLVTINNGWGGSSTYTYENDNGPSTSWYNWRVKQLNVYDGVNANPVKTTFAYSSPCYKDAYGFWWWCSTTTNTGELIGYGSTVETKFAYDGTTVVGKVIHYFSRAQGLQGKETEVLYQDAAGTTLRKEITEYIGFVISGMPPGNCSQFNYPNLIHEYALSNGNLVEVKRTSNDYDLSTGNLQSISDCSGDGTGCRTTNYEYITNPSVWILNTVSGRTLTDSNGAVLSEQQYGYDHELPGVGQPSTNKPTLSRVVNGAQTADTKYEYDNYGNLTTTQIYKSYGTTGSPSTGTPITYTTQYDDTLKTYPVSTTAPIVGSTTTDYDYGLGLPTSVEDPNENTTRTTYDGLGRVISVKYAGQDQENIQYIYPQPSGSPLRVTAPFSTRMHFLDTSVTPAVYRSAWQVMDGLGRVIQTQSPYETSGINDNLSVSDTGYNAQGQVLYSGLPRTVYVSNPTGVYQAPNWSAIAHTTSNYDALGRPISVAYPDGSTEWISYSGLRTATIDRNRHQKVQEKDAFGRVIKVEEYTGSNPYTLYATTQYSYDERDLLGQVIDAEGNQTSIHYDGFGRKIDMTDPDLGNWRYRYNALGNLTTQIDAKRQAINMYYDDLNRLLGKTYATSVNPDTYQTPEDPGYSGYDTKYYYDQGLNGKGHRTTMTDASGNTTTWSYNALGQVLNQTQNIDNTPYSTSTSFDAFGRPLTQTIPSNELLTYSYNAMGSLSALVGTNTYVSQIHYNASGQVTDQALGNGLVQQSCYYANTLRLANLRTYWGALQSCASSPASPQLNLSYGYQPNGNVSQISDITRNETLSYRYDELDRLVSGGGANSRSYTYGATGNITSQDTVLPNVGTTDLVSWWSLNESEGTRFDNHTNNHLADNNTVSSIAGKQGNAAQFVLTKSQAMRIPDNPALSMGTGARMTACTWTKLDSKNPSLVEELLAKGGNTGTWEYFLRYDGRIDRFAFLVYGGTLVEVRANVLGSPVLGQWYFVCGGYDGTNIWISVNAGARNTTAFTGTIADGSTELWVGGNSFYGSYLSGAMDEVVLYKRSLSTADVSWLYNSGVGKTYLQLNQAGSPGTANLVAWWSMDELGGIRYDSYSTNHLTGTKGTTAIAAKQASGAHFVRAKNDFMSVADNASVSMGSGSTMTVGAWVYLDTLENYQNIVAKRSNFSGNIEYFLRYENNAFTFYVSPDGSSTAIASVSTPPNIGWGMWYFVVAGYDGQNLWIEYNNGARQTKAYSSGIYNGTSSLVVGAIDTVTNAEQLNGSLDEVFLFKRSLSAQETVWLYNNGYGRTYADLSVAPPPGTPKTYTYDPNHKHAVASLSTGETYTYDANGNMTCRVEGEVTYKQDYNVENQLVTVSKMNGSCTSGTVIESTNFLYDGDGNLVKKTNPDQTKTIYVNGLYEVNKSSGGSVLKTTTYYPASGAMRVTIGGTSTLYFVLKDHLGSASVVTDASGNEIGTQHYYPFGETRSTTGSMNTDKLYTSQREITGLGIYHYGARFYSPYINHFVSADTVVSSYANPQTLNRYSYVSNNPLKYTDPTGHMLVEDSGGAGSVCPDQKCKDDVQRRKAKKEPWKYSHTVTRGMHLGPVKGFVPANFNDDSYNGWPRVYGDPHREDNFFISFNVTYNESTGIHISDLQYSNQYQGYAKLGPVTVNKNTVYSENSYLPLPATGGYTPIPDSGGNFRADQHVSISVNVSYVIDTGNGAYQQPVSLKIVLPSLAEVKNVLQTGEVSVPILGIP